MPTLKKKWDKLLEYSVILAAGLVMTFSAIILLLIIGVIVGIAKVLVFVK
jgi:hypothetical protein